MPTVYRSVRIVIGILVLILLILAGIIISKTITRHRQIELENAMQQTTTTTVQTLFLTSSAFSDNSQIPAKYSCQGENINPPLDIKDVAPNAKSLVLIVDDPDAPAGIWDHWIKFNIPPETIHIEEGKEPQGVSGKGSAGNLTYQGPCPPSGTHRYFFKIYSLDTLLDLPEGVSKQEVEKTMAGHIIQQATLLGLFTKK